MEVFPSLLSKAKTSYIKITDCIAGELYQNLVDMLWAGGDIVRRQDFVCSGQSWCSLFVSGDPKESADQPHQQPSGRTENALSGRGKHRRDGEHRIPASLPESVRERRLLRHERGKCRRNGSIFEDQMYRLGLPLSAYSEYVRRAKSVPRLAGRCSVFAKTDLIHRQQEGVPVEDILLGLSYAVIRNFKSAVVRKLPVQPPVLVTGGVVYNEGVRLAICDIFGLNEEELLCGEEGAVVSAAGIAACACHGKLAFDWKHPVRREVADEEQKESSCRDMTTRRRHFTGPDRYMAGKSLARIDVGSTSTNLVLTGEDGAVIDDLYLRTRGNPLGAVQQGMAQLKQKYGKHSRGKALVSRDRGGTYIAEKTGAGTVLDEITAQARAAAHLCPEVDTVFEIGGQDSKYISIRDGQVVDFEMNKVCGGHGPFCRGTGEPHGSIAGGDRKQCLEGKMCRSIWESAAPC